MAVKFRAHETFFIRKGWLSKGMKNVDTTPDVFISKTENPMDVLGIGANMVKSLRYWLQAVGLTSEPIKGRREQTLTPFGVRVYNNDPYTEEIGTLYLLHYKLATNQELATAWYYFFNELQMSEFTKEDFVRGVKAYLKSIGEAEYADRTIGDDFTCIINTYLPRYKSNPEKVTPENNIDCPLGELGLIDILDKKNKSYKKSIPSPDTFDPWVVLAVINDQAHGNEIRINDLLTKPQNIGAVFNLDSIAMLDILRKVEKTQEIRIIRTYGLDVIQLKQQLSFEQCVDEYYKNL